MTDQLYCPACGPDWLGAYDMNHRCVECGVALKAEKVMEKLKAVEEERDALAAHVVNSNADKLAAAHNIRAKCTDDAHLLGVADMLERSAGEDPATSLDRLKAECWKEAYLAGMEHGHHWTVEGGYVPDDEESADDYVADRQSESP